MLFRDHHLLTKGVVSSCRLIFLPQDRHCFHLSINLNTSPPLTPVLNQNISRKSVNPNIRILKKEYSWIGGRWRNSDCLIFLPFHHICHLYSQKQFKYLDIFNAKTFEKLQTISCFPLLYLCIQLQTTHEADETGKITK